MEVFLDGGLFELLIAVLFASFLNFIFIRKYLLVIFSGIVVAAPLLLYFLHGGELYYWLLSLCLFNAVLLVVVIWKIKHTSPATPLFDVTHLKNKMKDAQGKVALFFMRLFR